MRVAALVALALARRAAALAAPTSDAKLTARRARAAGAAAAAVFAATALDVTALHGVQIKSSTRLQCARIRMF